MKTYVLIISRTFPATHPQKGKTTGFKEKILLATGCPDCEENQDLSGMNISQCNSCLRHAMVSNKIHTIRANYNLWEKRIKAIQEGKAVLSVRYWSASPYNYKKDNSKQIEVLRLDKDSGIGIQKLSWTIDHSGNYRPILYYIIKIIDLKELAQNDGLSMQDFNDWFKNYDLSEDMGIIHFTPFRY